jgi:hypothetical protein
MALTRKYYLKNNYLTLRSKGKVVQMSALRGDISFSYLKQFFLVYFENVRNMLVLSSIN